MPDYGVYKDFTKKEFHELVVELELGVDSSLNTREIMEAIYKDIETNGLPEPDQCSNLLFDFLVAAEYIREDGSPIEPMEVKSTEVEDGGKMPSCFGYQDDLDPACRKCSVVYACKKQRLSSRPECFGKLYDKHAEECKACLEAQSCRLSK